MTLSEFLKDVDDTQTVKIGFDKGSAFIYCGGNDSKLVEALEKEQTHQLRYIPSFITRQKCKLKKLYAERKIATEKKIPALTEKINCVRESIKEATAEINRDPYSYLERNVVDVYDSIVTANQKIVVIDGIVNGKFWDIEEFENGTRGK